MCINDKNLTMHGVKDDRVDKKEYSKIEIKMFRCSDQTREVDDPICKSDD